MRHRRGYCGSLRQPTAYQSLFTFTEFSDRSLAIQQDVRDMAAFYAPTPGWESEMDTEGSWDSCGENEYVHRRIVDADAALAAMEEFEFPLSIRQEANRAARYLVSLFEEVTRLHRVDDLPQGKLDRRKLPSVAMHTAAGDYDADRIRPFRRIQPSPAKPPTVAVVASGSYGEMWADSAYIPRILTLTLGVLWAGEAAGLPMYAALTCGHNEPHGYRNGLLINMLAQPEHTISLNTYGVMLHRDLYRWGSITLLAADAASNARFNRLDGRHEHPPMCGRNYHSSSGGNAGLWAREVLGADLVIGIGSIQDTCDVKLSGKFTIEEAVRDIARQMEAKR